MLLDQTKFSSYQVFMIFNDIRVKFFYFKLNILIIIFAKERLFSFRYLGLFYMFIGVPYCLNFGNPRTDNLKDVIINFSV